MLSHTNTSIIQLRLPASIHTVNLLVHIRDEFNCIYEYYHLPSVSILRNDSIIELLTSSDQNIVGQMITSISQLFNEINIQTIETAARSN